MQIYRDNKPSSQPASQIPAPKPAAQTPRPAPAGQPAREPTATACALKLDLGGGLSLEFAQAPIGEFLMGSAPTEAGHRPHELPQHRVRFKKPFFVGRFPVTVGQFRQFVVEGGYLTDAEKGGRAIQDGKKGGVVVRRDWTWWVWEETANWRAPMFPVDFQQTDLHPVVLVSWYDAKAFCQWLSKKSGRVIRLPSEAEWEYACRAGNNGRFCFGDDDLELVRYAWYSENSSWKTHPVGTRQVNAWNIHDLHGLVHEWCEDIYNYDYTGAPSDGSAWASGPAKDRVVLRGGSWANDLLCARSAARICKRPDDRGVDWGFRVVCDLPLKAGSASA